MSEPNAEVELIKEYLKCQIGFYSECAQKMGSDADAARAQMCRIILEDIERPGAIALGIDRLKSFAVPVRRMR